MTSSGNLPQLRLQDWFTSHSEDGILQYHEFFRGVAQARYVLRRVMRIVDEQAKIEGLDPLEHQLLLQLYGSEHLVLGVNKLAARLDVPAAVVSRLLKRLESRALVERRQSGVDRRGTNVFITDAGKNACVAIWHRLKLHVDYFQKQLTEDEKLLALGVFGFYVGVAMDPVPADENLRHSPQVRKVAGA
jgi:DNA-binding MarR family transcriptional regulator